MRLSCHHSTTNLRFLPNYGSVYQAFSHFYAHPHLHRPPRYFFQDLENRYSHEQNTKYVCRLDQSCFIVCRSSRILLRSA